MLKKFYQYELAEAGCDEAGRGCLAGPVFAAAVILHPQREIAGLNDSKKLNEQKRYALREEIERKALAWAVASVDHEEIDAINILNASFLAMHKAIAALKKKPQLLLIDGNRFKPYKKLAHVCIIKGDGLYQAIAAASVLAKTYRDDYMRQIAAEFPAYGWEQNKGYGTLMHRRAIAEHGASAYHRKSFTLLPEQFSLF